MAELTAAQSAAISAQIAAIKASIAQVSTGVQTLSTAKAAGMTITPTTTVAQAAAYTAPKTTTVAPAPAPSVTAPAPAPVSTYTGVSVVDYLKSVGQASDYASRAALAAQQGITNYTGTAAQNTQLLNTLRSGAAPTATTTTGVKEIDTSQAPAIPTIAGDMLAEGVGISASAQSQIDALQKRLDELANQKPSPAVEQQKKSILDLITKRETAATVQKSATELRQEAITQAYSEMGVTPQQIQAMGGLIGQITSYNEQIANIEIQKQTALDKTEMLGMSAGYIAGEQNRLTKQYNSEISAKALQAGVKVQELQMLQGAYSEAKATAAQIVNLATYDQQQELADIEWSLSAHQDLYALLSGEEQTAWNRQYTMAREALNIERNRISNISKYVTDPTTADAFKGIDWTALSETQAAQIVGEYTQSPAYLNKLAALGAAGRAPEEGVAGVSSIDIFNDILQTAIDAGAAPEMAAQAAVLYAEQNGISLSAKERAALVARARTLTKTPLVPTPTPPTPVSPEELGKYLPSALKETITAPQRWIAKQSDIAYSFFKGLFGL